MRCWTPLITLALLAWTLFAWFEALDDAQWRVRHLVGLGTIVPSFVCWALARWQLGTAFTVRAEARRLVTRGIYARIRHPVYVFGELLTVGLFVFFGRPAFFALFAVTIPMQVVRARREERVLEAAFGDAYRDHRRRTWF